MLGFIVDLPVINMTKPWGKPRCPLRSAEVDLEGLESDFGSRALSFTDFRHLGERSLPF